MIIIMATISTATSKNPEETLSLLPTSSSSRCDDPGQSERPDDSLAGATLLSSTANLTNTIIGAGMLSLPLAFSLVGYVGGVFMLLFCVFCADFSIGLLLSLSDTTERYTYEGIAQSAFGRKGVIVVSVSIILLNIGALTAYNIIIGDVLPGLISAAAPEFLDPDWARYWCVGVVNMVVFLPLSLLRRIDALSASSAISIICVALFVGTMVAMVASGREKNDAAPPDQDPTPFRASTDVFRAFSLFAFAFTCHTNVFPIYLELGNRSRTRMVTVAHSALTTCFVIYLAVGLSGYLDYTSTLEGVQGDVLVNLARSETGPVSATVQTAYAISIALTYPLGIVPIRQACAALLFGGDHPTTWPLQRHVTISLSLVAVNFLIGIFVPELDFVFGLAGATAGVTIVYILPALMTLKMLGHRLAMGKKLLLYALIAMGVIMGISATVVSSIDYAESVNEHP